MTANANIQNGELKGYEAATFKTSMCLFTIIR